MPKTRGYKRVENTIFRSIGRSLCKGASSVHGVCSSISQGGQRKLTIMVVPHSQKRVINFQTTVFSLLFFAVALTGIFGSFFWFSRRAIVSEQNLTELREEARTARASLDELKDETGNLFKAAQNFQAAFSGTLSLIGMDNAQPLKSNIQNGDLSSLFNVKETAQGSVREIAELKHLTGYLENSVQPIQEIGKLLESQSTLFSDIPSLWPIRGGIGHVSMAFGQNRHPFTGQWYIHKGVDLSTYRAGDSILATADGQVVTAEYDPGFGYYLIIKHKHGFYTRYAHMQSFRVQRGQYVQQGQIIGYIGNTGVSTGPHLHYEVHIGSDVVDPMKYLNIKVASGK
ncbi:MAG: M23 family metallopeptidase [Spirochaetales bacterium]|nr:M23 family metallopeptidase [Spirochaetales bacterium]HNQ96829.1 M23 family metallopeptidase [Treponemataceae bacterium]